MSGMHSKGIKGLSLLELLTVMAIMSLLTVLTLPAISGLSSSSKLRSASSTIWSLGQLARQNSLGQNTLTALVISGQAAFPSDGMQRIGLFELRAKQDGSVLTSADWRQVTPWRKLPLGVLVDQVNSTFFTSPAANPSPALPSAFTSGGETISAYAAQIFLPNGSLMADSAVNVKLIPAILQNGLPIITTKNNGGAPANYVTVTILSTTGQSKVEEP